MSKEQMKDIAVEAAKASPPVAVVTHSMATGWTMNHTAVALTIFYLLLQIAWLIWRWRQAVKGQPVKGE